MNVSLVKIIYKGDKQPMDIILVLAHDRHILDIGRRGLVQQQQIVGTVHWYDSPGLVVTENVAVVFGPKVCILLLSLIVCHC